MLGRRRRKQEERSAGGQPILRHEAVDRPFQAATHGEPGIREAIEAHLEEHLGPSESVFHEIVSDLVHIDVYIWTPTDDRPMYTFVTVGMSDLPMTVPADARRAGAAPRAELMICLPPTWPVRIDDLSVAPWDDEDAYFPIRWLKQLARLPHEYKTWLGFGHTIPNGDPPEPLATTTSLCGWVLLPPVTVPEPMRRLELADGPLDFFAIVALHGDEMDHKLAHGVESLFDGFDREGVTELLDVTRPSSLSS